MKYAEVSVNAPAAQRQTFSYSIPSELTVDVGQAVYVPFGQKTLQGLVVELTDVPAFEPTRDITGVIDTQPSAFEEACFTGKMAQRLLPFAAFRCVSFNAAAGI